MQGKIADFGIPEIFQLLGHQSKSGALTVRGDDRETVFLFSDGKIVDVQPDRRRAQSGLLGNMLVDAGYLTEEELRRLLAAQEREGKRIGEILVSRGKISQETLTRYLYLQAKESLYYTLRIREGDYRFETYAVRPSPWTGAPLRSEVLLMEGLQFLDEYPILRSKFPPGRFYLSRKRGARIDPKVLPSEERVVWECLDFSPDPYRIFRKACLTWFEGLKALYILVDRGLVDLSSAVEEPAERDLAARAERARQLRIGVLRAVAWLVALSLTGLWLYRTLLSPSGSAVFSPWAGFFG